MVVLLLGIGLVISASAAGDLNLENEFSEPTDSDGDGLLNGVESARETVGGFPLPESDPEHKDLYVQMYVGNGIPPLTDDEKADLREIWANFPVTNPDNESGINLHITQVQLSRTISADLDSRELREQKDQLYTRLVPEAAQCSVNLVVLVNVEGNPSISGRGDAPGYVAIANGLETQRYNTEYTVRTTIITHELLHNIVGEFEDGSMHTSEGWLNGEPEEHGTQYYLSNQTVSRLSEEGFAESDYYQEEVCG